MHIIVDEILKVHFFPRSLSINYFSQGPYCNLWIDNSQIIVCVVLIVCYLFYQFNSPKHLIDMVSETRSVILLMHSAIEDAFNVSPTS